MSLGFRVEGLEHRGVLGFRDQPATLKPPEPDQSLTRSSRVVGETGPAVGVQGL